jgi:hypothetical protein
LHSFSCFRMYVKRPVLSVVEPVAGVIIFKKL